MKFGKHLSSESLPNVRPNCPSTHGQYLFIWQTFAQSSAMARMNQKSVQKYRRVLAATAYYYMTVNNYMQEVQKHKMIKKPWKNRRWWMLSIHRNRSLESMEHMFAELLQEPSGEFSNFCRMSSSDFEILLQKIGYAISKKDTKWRPAVPAKIRLAVTLRFLATGDSYRSLHFLFKISSQLISKIIPEVCAAIYTALEDEIKLPTTEEEWLRIADGFKNRFPHCIGALDGKHVVLQAPALSGSEYYNYKKSFSVVLMALVDSQYNFIFADVGCQGRISDGGVLKNTLLWQKLNTNTLNLPHPSPLPNGSPNLPYVFLADGAFALDSLLMKPFPGVHREGSMERIFNNKLSSARVVVENVFGVWTSVFRVFRKPILLEPETVSTITLASLVLHNFLRRSRTSSSLYTPPGTFDNLQNDVFVPGSWRNDAPTDTALASLQNIPRRASSNAMKTRIEFAKYFHNSSNM